MTCIADRKVGGGDRRFFDGKRQKIKNAGKKLFDKNCLNTQHPQIANFTWPSVLQPTNINNKYKIYTHRRYTDIVTNTEFK